MVAVINQQQGSSQSHTAADCSLGSSHLIGRHPSASEVQDSCVLCHIIHALLMLTLSHHQIKTDCCLSRFAINKLA